MLEMLRAHGLDAGPTQRPVLAGALSGALAQLPAFALWNALGTPAALLHAGGGPPLLLWALSAALLTIAGTGYGLLFRRAANDGAGGWLFGMAFGYLLWQIVAVPMFQWLPEEPLLAGRAALGLLVGHLLWGFGMGLSFPWVHRPLQGRVDQRAPGTVREGWR